MTPTEDLIQEHNKPLYDHMIKTGHKLHSKPHGESFLQFFVKKDDPECNYVPYPVGYITGPSSVHKGHLQKGYSGYISVRQKSGCWWQQKFTPATFPEVVHKAIEEAKKHLI